MEHAHEVHMPATQSAITPATILHNLPAEPVGRHCVT
jgi:hypothetical protein